MNVNLYVDDKLDICDVLEGHPLAIDRQKFFLREAQQCKFQPVPRSRVSRKGNVLTETF